MRSIKLRVQQPELPRRRLRLHLSGRLASDLEEYGALYARAHGKEIDMPALIEGILSQFLATDRAFNRRRIERPGAATPTSSDTTA